MNTTQQSQQTNTIHHDAKTLYTARAHTVGGRDGGSSRTSDGRLDVRLSLPGGPGSGTNPEQLFAAGWSGCFLSAIKFVAAQKKLRLPADPAIDAEVDLVLGDEGHFIRGRLNVSLPGMDRQAAQKLIEEAHQVCTYSKAVRGNIDTEIKLV